jgi:hypothetical protein
MSSFCRLDIAFFAFTISSSTAMIKWNDNEHKGDNNSRLALCKSHPKRMTAHIPAQKEIETPKNTDALLNRLIEDFRAFAFSLMLINKSACRWSMSLK